MAPLLLISTFNIYPKNPFWKTKAELICVGGFCVTLLHRGAGWCGEVLQVCHNAKEDSVCCHCLKAGNVQTASRGKGTVAETIHLQELHSKTE